MSPFYAPQLHRANGVVFITQGSTINDLGRGPGGKFENEFIFPRDSLSNFFPTEGLLTIFFPRRGLFKFFFSCGSIFKIRTLRILVGGWVTENWLFRFLRINISVHLEIYTDTYINYNNTLKHLNFVRGYPRGQVEALLTLNGHNVLNNGPIWMI